MVHIISKRDGPRREDVAAKTFIEKNRATIDSLANHLTAGRWGELRNPAPAQMPAPSGKLWFTPPSRPQEAMPYVRISLNDRVVVADLASGRQLHFIGEIRGASRARRFTLATQENGFFAPVDDGLRQVLADLDGLALPDASSEERLKQDIAARLGFDKVPEEAG
jgi:hypothetical protein